MENRQVIKDLRVALKDFEPMVRNPVHLWNGRDIKNFKLRPREAWANWLLCAVLQKLIGTNITFAEDDEGDGIIFDKLSGQIVPTEHVAALEIPKGKKLPLGEQRIIDAIQHKIERGPDYAVGKWLVVFFDGAQKFYRNKIREAIYGKHNFVAVFCVGLLNSGPMGYEYIATEFRNSYGQRSVSFKICINNDFTGWEILQVTE